MVASSISKIVLIAEPNGQSRVPMTRLKIKLASQDKPQESPTATDTSAVAEKPQTNSGMSLIGFTWATLMVWAVMLTMATLLFWHEAGWMITRQ